MFDIFGLITNLTLVPKKSIAFVTYQHESEALRAIEEMKNHQYMTVEEFDLNYSENKSI